MNKAQKMVLMSFVDCSLHAFQLTFHVLRRSHFADKRFIAKKRQLQIRPAGAAGFFIHKGVIKGAVLILQ